jgi:hypothetical protein
MRCRPVLAAESWPDGKADGVRHSHPMVGATSELSPLVIS